MNAEGKNAPDSAADDKAALPDGAAVPAENAEENNASPLPADDGGGAAPAAPLPPAPLPDPITKRWQFDYFQYTDP